jgi:hypothetical protein
VSARLFVGHLLKETGLFVDAHRTLTHNDAHTVPSRAHDTSLASIPRAPSRPPSLTIETTHEIVGVSTTLISTLYIRMQPPLDGERASRPHYKHFPGLRSSRKNNDINADTNSPSRPLPIFPCSNDDVLYNPVFSGSHASADYSMVKDAQIDCCIRGQLRQDQLYYSCVLSYG